MAGFHRNNRMKFSAFAEAKVHMPIGIVAEGKFDLIAIKPRVGARNDRLDFHIGHTADPLQGFQDLLVFYLQLLFVAEVLPEASSTRGFLSIDGFRSREVRAFGLDQSGSILQHLFDTSHDVLWFFLGNQNTDLLSWQRAFDEDPKLLLGSAGPLRAMKRQAKPAEDEFLYLHFQNIAFAHAACRWQKFSNS